MLIDTPVQTRRALLTWQRPLGYGGDRDRFAVGELSQGEEGVHFAYLPDGVAAAEAQGFDGYPGLPMGRETRPDEAVRVLLRRLPPRGRSDFGEYLAGYGLDPAADISDLSLLAYTGARVISESDGFGVTETFEGFGRPFRYLFDVAGYRHYRPSLPDLAVGDALHFIPDDNNPKDDDAVEAVTATGARVGYANRLQAPVLREWMREAKIGLRVFRINPRPAYPRLFAMAEIESG